MANAATVQEVHRIQDLQEQRPKIDCNLNKLKELLLHIHLISNDGICRH